MDNKYKIGYSELGGLFIGKNIQSDYHKNHLISIIISFGEPFIIWNNNNEILNSYAVLIQKDISYKLQSGNRDNIVFIHIDPYSEIGMILTLTNTPIKSFKCGLFSVIINDFKKWFSSKDNRINTVESFLRDVSEIMAKENPKIRAIDARIIKCFEYIKMHPIESITLKDVAEWVYLSESRLTHLFKEEIGITFKQFLLHRKLILSIHAMFQDHNLSESSFLGGFADQAHFSKSFKNAFGINPSSTNK